MENELAMAVFTQLEYLLRVFLAGVCGFAIGVERRNRMKSAGPRTHLLVCAASGLMMLVSKYGFFDVLTNPSVKLDPSRVAASIITGITFMGAGLIFVHKREVTGVTTAAGLWATVGVGMALGAGMYVLGIASCVMIILFQVLLHSNFRLFQEPWIGSVSLKLDCDKIGFLEICEVLQGKNIDILEPKVKHIDEHTLAVKFVGRFPAGITNEDMAAFLGGIDGVHEVRL